LILNLIAGLVWHQALRNT